VQRRVTYWVLQDQAGFRLVRQFSPLLDRADRNARPVTSLSSLQRVASAPCIDYLQGIDARSRLFDMRRRRASTVSG
jgi:hypothetical protein